MKGDAKITRVTKAKCKYFLYGTVQMDNVRWIGGILKLFIRGAIEVFLYGIYSKFFFLELFSSLNFYPCHWKYYLKIISISFHPSDKSLLKRFFKYLIIAWDISLYYNSTVRIPWLFHQSQGLEQTEAVNFQANVKSRDRYSNFLKVIWSTWLKGVCAFSPFLYQSFFAAHLMPPRTPPMHTLPIK